MATAVEHMQADMATVLHDLGEGAISITYAGTSVIARVLYGRRRDRDRDAKTMVRTAWVRVLKTDVPGPKYQARVVSGAETWTMQEIEAETASTYRLRLETNKRQGWR